jgi:hypothetical protein
VDSYSIMQTLFGICAFAAIVMYAGVLVADAVLQKSPRQSANKAQRNLF